MLLIKFVIEEQTTTVFQHLYSVVFSIQAAHNKPYRSSTSAECVQKVGSDRDKTFCFCNFTHTIRSYFRTYCKIKTKNTSSNKHQPKESNACRIENLSVLRPLPHFKKHLC